MKLGILSASYKTVAVEIREKLAVGEQDVAPLIAFLKSRCGLKEVMVLSTCNRVELYFHHENPLLIAEKVESRFREFIKQEELDFQFIRLFGREAVRHIFRVAGSLESMVIGEPQILGQVKDFLELSTKGGGCGFMLKQVMNRVILTSKRVRNETQISRFAVSISFAATELARKIFNDLQDKVVLIIGAGEMAELAARHLLKAGCSHLLVTNRTFSRAVALAEKFQGSAVRYEQLEKHLENADIIISSTGATNFILTSDLVLESMKRRRYRPIFLIDIAVPRDIDPDINRIDNAYLYDIDDLQTVVDDNLKERQKEAMKAESIIEDELDRLEDNLAVRDVVPVIKNFREKIQTLAEYELAKGMKHLDDLSEEQKQSIRFILNGFAQKLMHNPTVTLKQKAREGTMDQDYIQIIKDLFDLNLQEEKEPSKVINIK